MRDAWRRRWTRVVQWVEGRDWDEGAILMAIGAAMGVSAGLGVVAFYKLIDGAYFVFAKWLGGRLEPVVHALTLPLITAASAFSAGRTCCWPMSRSWRTRCDAAGRGAVALLPLAVSARTFGVSNRPVQ